MPRALERRGGGAVNAKDLRGSGERREEQTPEGLAVTQTFYCFQ
jgi:hypothetical protein